MARRKRILGKRIDFRNLTYAPVNELGVVFLFGVLHKELGFHVESVQQGYPDCTAKRKKPDGRWEDLCIEFEFRSSSFIKHKHNPDHVNIIVCWEHDSKRIPDDLEVIELSKFVLPEDTCKKGVKENKKRTKRPLSKWQLFCQEKRLEGLDFSEITKLWKEMKH